MSDDGSKRTPAADSVLVTLDRPREAHIVPADEDREHQLSRDCWCNPVTVEGTNGWWHFRRPV